MDMDKFLQWMELAKKYQSSNFWSEIFDQSSFDEFMKNNDFARTDTTQAGDMTQQSNFPPTDIYVTDGEVILILDIAGYMKEEIQLSVSGTRLLIKGFNNRVIPGELVQQERFHGEFERVIQLPEPAYPNQIKAKFNNGLLIVSYKRQFIHEEHVPIE
ncbi:Hsp20/alpha crystallin family protein [Schinkia azotoformans]|uniref:Hsp20/alpha crystallin family protein n=1 Tax=Schinkia azotoformans TaxID=1454 RepID=UPI002DBE5C01|nr:Hsp20/alpha crystallin family protein [Schinkia azotoformans]MEC1719771.1 Hsp20/alpha crystallin family protein [Schinkia azotoformans]MED4412661.1 Hsp20/alpha crystallin family protein [Schinkia azotoformans]